MTSVLESKFVEQTRPYSQDELNDMRNKLYRSLRLGETKAHHERCNHFYLVKQNGRKEKEIKEQNSPDVGNCSVCWKLSKTPNNFRRDAQQLVEAYSQIFYNEPKYLSYDKVDVEVVFCKWLYEEINN